MTSVQIPEDIAKWVKHHAKQLGQSPEDVLRDMFEQYEAKSTQLPFREVVESTLLSCIIVDAQQPDNPIIYANPAFEETTGYTQEDAIGQNCRFLQGDDRDQAGLKPLRHAIKNGESCVVALRNYRKDGTLFWNELHIAPIYDTQGILTHFIGFQKDITEQVERQQELRRSRARFEGVLNSQIDLVCRYTLDTTLTYVNDAYCDHFGKTREELLDHSFLSLVPVHYHPFILGHIEAMKQNPKPMVEIFSTVDENGAVEWVQWVDHGITDESGAVTEIQAVGRDITPLVESRKQLEIQQKKLKSILENIPVMIAQFDPDRQFEYVNQHLEDVLGWDWEALRNHPDILRELLADPDSRQEARQFMVSREHGWQDFELRTRDGSTLITSWTKVHLPGGNYVGIGIDMTRRKQMEEALRTSERKYRTMLEKATEGVVLVDSHGKITMVNHYIEDTFQMSRDDLIGQSVDVLLPVDDRVAHTSHRNHYMADPSERPMGADRELSARRKDGTIFPVEVSLTPIKIDDETHIMAFLVDITERKQLEEQRIYSHKLEAELEKERQLRELKGRFNAIVSHEFRTPLSSILSSVDLIDNYFDRLSQDRIRDKLDSIRTRVKHMVTLMEDMLRLSKNETGNIDFLPKEIAISSFMDHLIETMRLTDTGVHTMIVNYSVQTIQADPRLLDHILSNLISNALKYSPDQTTITITISDVENGWYFEVTDQGIGIPEEDMPQLFEPFHRAGNVLDVVGTGLGLSIVKDYVEYHQGNIAVESVEGEGTTVSVFIPQLTLQNER